MARTASLAAVLLGLTCGCSVVNEIGPATCDRSPDDNKPVLYTEGEVDGNVYRSAALTCPDGGIDAGGEGGGVPDCELLYFPGGMRYEIVHKLGAKPDWFEFYLSFDQYGLATGTLATATGNQAELKSINDKELVVVNGSCSEYWLLVVAGTGAKATP